MASGTLDDMIESGLLRVKEMCEEGSDDYPDAVTSPDLRLAFWPKKPDVRASYEQVLSWEVAANHSQPRGRGLCFEANGGMAIRRAFRRALGG